MSIDWITVAAQIVNFLVLVWLLKRFLYRPILDGIDARETEITNRMQEAARAEEKAQTVESDYHEKVQALHVAQSDMTETIRKKAEDRRDALLAEAHQKMDREHKAWQAHLDDEARKYTARMHRAGAGALLELTRKALSDLADETLEGRMAHHVAKQIAPMATDLRRAAGEPANAVVSSHDPLPSSAQDDLAAAMKVVFPQIALQFETDEDQAPGLVLRMGGAQLAWTIDTYIDGLDALMEEQLAIATDPKVPVHER